jgi:hypothetical protein
MPYSLSSFPRQPHPDPDPRRYGSTDFGERQGQRWVVQASDAPSGRQERWPQAVERHLLPLMPISEHMGGVS